MPDAPKPKHPGRVAGGRAAMRRRWGPRRHVRLDTLPPDVAHTIRLILDAEESRARRAVQPETGA